MGEELQDIEGHTKYGTPVSITTETLSKIFNF